MYSHLNDATARMVLASLSSQKSDTVVLSYTDYRIIFSIVQVPAIETLCNSEGKRMLVKVNKQQAIEYIKKKHNFLDRKELRKELEDAASDLSRDI